MLLNGVIPLPAARNIEFLSCSFKINLPRGPLIKTSSLILRECISAATLLSGYFFIDNSIWFFTVGELDMLKDLVPEFIVSIMYWPGLKSRSCLEICRKNVFTLSVSCFIFRILTFWLNMLPFRQAYLLCSLPFSLEFLFF